MSKKKHTFKLSGVNPEEIDKQYNFKILSEQNIPQQTTKISELQHFKHTITLVDELKNSHNIKVSMIHGQSYNCFWDRHPFTGPPVYCPIERTHKPLVKKYTSYINGKEYKIQDSVQDTKYQEYSVDGIFCSTECCLAYIDENIHNPMYQNSEYYLKEIFSFSEQKRAPHWRLLVPYGGNQSIEEFRKSFVNTIYIPDGIVYNPICFLFRENYHL